MVNFFSVEKGERQMIFADLPGYGYSAVGREARKDWVALMDKYLARRGIHAFLFLLDSRRAADMADEDLELIKNLADRRAPEGVTVVLTKSDKLSANELQKTLKSVKGTLAASRLKSVRIMAVSTLKDKGMEDLRRLVLAPLD